MYNHSAEHSLPENYNGLGYLNLITMIFEIEILLSEFRMESNENELPADINLLFIEEPEAHTHPQMQYIFIKNIKDILVQASNGDDGKAFNLQTIITTHSPHIVSVSNFDDIKYFYKSENNQVYSKNLKDLQNEYEKDGELQSFKFLKQYLTLNRAELFFVDKAIFIEGDTERILLPAIMKKIDQEYNDNPLLSQNISVVEVGAYSQVFEKFIDFIGVKSLIITDIDSAKIHEVDDKGKKKEKIEKCRVLDREASITTNASLRYFLVLLMIITVNIFLIQK
ncbi:ATP-dependent nuclease [Brevibacillus laterosporus]